LASGSHVGVLLRSWRKRRRLSQIELALEARVSAKHLSFIETGRSRPSAQMIALKGANSCVAVTRRLGSTRE
jgi:transcriptional regulator with XRE-family HTH domain